MRNKYFIVSQCEAGLNIVAVPFVLQLVGEYYPYVIVGSFIESYLLKALFVNPANLQSVAVKLKHGDHGRLKLSLRGVEQLKFVAK